MKNKWTQKRGHNKRDCGPETRTLTVLTAGIARNASASTDHRASVRCLEGEEQIEQNERVWVGSVCEDVDHQPGEQAEALRAAWGEECTATVPNRVSVIVARVLPS